jgi:hypothetical protein
MLMHSIGAWHVFIKSKPNYTLSNFISKRMITMRRKNMKHIMKVLFVGLLCLMALFGIVSAAQVRTTTENILPSIDGTISPSDLCDGYVEFTLEVGKFAVPLKDDQYCDTSDPKRCVDVNFYVIDTAGNWVADSYDPSTGDSRENAFDFSGANFDIEQVVVHAGKLGSNVYDYRAGSVGGGTGPVRADTRLTAPQNPTNSVYPGLSGIGFCGGIATPEFPTIAVPVGMMIGIVGIVYVVRKRES